jgi:hypothetical protein
MFIIFSYIIADIVIAPYFDYGRCHYFRHFCQRHFPPFSLLRHAAIAMPPYAAAMTLI